MEETIKQQTEKPQEQPLTREEVWRRLKANRRHKEEFVEHAKKILTEVYKQRTGQEPTGFEVW